MRYLHATAILRKKVCLTITEVTGVETVQKNVRTPNLQTKMANFASPFWRKLQAARQDYLTLREQRCRHNIEITSIAAYAPGDQRCFCRSY